MNSLLTRPRQWFQNAPLSQKLILGVSALTVSTLTIALVILGSVLQSSLTAQIGSSLNSVSRSIANSVGDHVANEIKTLQLLAGTQVVINDIEAINSSYGNSESFALERIQQINNLWLNAQLDSPLLSAGKNYTSAHELLRFLQSTDEFISLITVDRFGGAVAYTTPPSQFDLSKEVWRVQAHNEGQGNIYLSPPAFDNLYGYYVTIALPIYHPIERTRVVGVLAARYRLKQLAGQINNSDNSKLGIESYLVTRDGKRLDVLTENIKVPESELVHLQETHAEDTAENWHVGTYGFDPSIITHLPVATNEEPLKNKDLTWVLITRQELDVAFAPVQTITRTVVALGFVTLIIILLFTINIARQLTRPIAELTLVARAAEQGDLNQTAQTTSQDEIGLLSQAFNSLIIQIRNSTSGLRTEVAERTEQLAAVNEIAATVSSSLDIAQVLSRTVNLIRDRLDYYHVSIFLLDEKQQFAIVRESTGEVGRIMKERGHRLEIGSQSLIGYVTAERKARIAQEVGADAVYFNNPLLPNTRSEIALPLLVGSELLGALDVQSEQPNAFNDSDVAVLQSMANQIAVAINNARLFQESQARVEDVSRLNRQYLAQSWSTYAKEKSETVNFEFADGHTQASPNVSDLVQLTTPYLAADGSTLGIPIQLRGETIGEFSLAAPAESIRWTESDLLLAQGVVNQVALAIENARLLEETQNSLAATNRLAQRERLVAEMTQKITSGVDIRRALQIAAEELRRGTNSRHAVVTLTLPNEEKI